MPHRSHARAAQPISLESPAAASSVPPDASEPPLADLRWREHDLMIRRFHRAALAPDEIAVVLNSKGLRVRTWHVSESFVRSRLKALGLSPKPSRLYYQHSKNRYRER